jgi:hypothetical protein
MKPEYKIRVSENLEAILKRTSILSEMMEGKRMPNTQDAIKMNKEIEKLVELTQNIIDLS